MSDYCYRWKQNGEWQEWMTGNWEHWSPVEAIKPNSNYYFEGVRRDEIKGLLWLFSSGGINGIVEVQFSTPSILEQELLALELVKKHKPTKKRKRKASNENQ